MSNCSVEIDGQVGDGYPKKLHFNVKVTSCAWTSALVLNLYRATLTVKVSSGLALRC